MGFTIPDLASASYSTQANPRSGDFTILAAADNATGVISGCAVTAQAVPDLTVAVASGVVGTAGNANGTVTAGNVVIVAADVTNPRWDLVVASSTGTKSAVAGTAAAVPLFPATSSVVLAAVYVPALTVTITSGMIVDKRVTLSAPLHVHPESDVTNLTTDLATKALKLTPTAKTAAYTAVDGDAVLADATTAAFTVTLPTATAGRHILIKKTDASANAVTIGGTVDGTANPTLLNRYQAVELIADGTNWQRIVRMSVDSLVGSLAGDVIGSPSSNVISPGADVNFNLHKITNLKAGLTLGDAVEFNQLPSSQRRTGAIAETFSRKGASFTNLTAIASGGLVLVSIPLPAGAIISTITFLSGTAALVTGTHAMAGIWRYSDRALLASSADDTNVTWAANNEHGFSLTSAYTVGSSGFYYIGFFVVASTPPSLLGTTDSNTTPAALGPITVGTSNTGITTLPDPAIALTAIARDPWAYVS